MPQALAYRQIAAFYAITNDTQVPLSSKLLGLLDLGRRAFGLELGMVARIHGGIFEILAVSPGNERLYPGACFDLGQTYCSVTLQAPEPVGFDSASGGPWANHPCFQEFRLEAYLGARIMVSGVAWGTLSFSSLKRLDRPHAEEDFLFLKLMAQWLGHACEEEARKEQLARLEAEAEAARTVAFCRDIVHAIGEGVLAYEETHPHRIRFANPAAEALIGRSESGLIGHPLSEAIHLQSEASDPDSAPGKAGVLGRLAEHGAFEALVSSLWRPHPFPVAFISARPLDGAGLAVLTFREISEEWQTREHLRLAEQVFEYSPEAILVTDGNGTILRVNPAFTLITGYRPEEAIGRNPRLLRSDRHDADFYRNMWQALLEQGHWHGEIWDRRKTGEVYPKWLCINAVRLPSGEMRFVALFADISERKAHEQRIDYLAHHDVLTGLGNRRHLEERGESVLNRARRHDAGVALLLIDLDRFKHINDSLGHAVGDQLLIEVAGRLNGVLRGGDTLARLGGDEFVVLAEGIDEPRDVIPLAEKIRASLAAPYEIAGHTLHTSPSIGIGLCPADGRDLEALLKAADIAMYQVKSDSRNGWRFFEPSMDEAVRARHQLEQDLRTALDQSQLSLHYQPQFELASRRVIAWEALLRWQHPALGNIPPDEFIPLAEETGLIIPIGKWVLATACRDAQGWTGSRRGDERLAVNISARQLERPEFVDELAAILAVTGLPPERLELELTERVLLGNSPLTQETLDRLKALGVKLTLDDFGTGYATLSCLTHFTVDRLKIDRSFMADLDKPGNAAVIAAVVALARALDMDVVAEGVETGDQLAFLLDKGCMRAQGFLYGHPMPAERVPAFASDPDTPT